MGCFLLHQNLLLKIADVRRWLHPGCGTGTAPREWEVLHTDTALGILPGCRALMAPLVQRRIEEVRVHKHFLTSCICPAAAAMSASPLEPSCSLLPLCARHPSSVPSGLRTCKHSLKCDTYPLSTMSHKHHLCSYIHMPCRSPKPWSKYQSVFMFRTRKSLLQKTNTKFYKITNFMAACASLLGSGCCWLAAIRASAWEMHAGRWWIWADPSPLPGCPVPPVTNGKHLWDSWQGEGWRRGHAPGSPASAQIKGSLAFSSYQINLLAPMICIALSLLTAVKSVKQAEIGFGFWHFSTQSLHYTYYTYSRAVGLLLFVCKDNFKNHFPK